jgi:hypothetical protein
MTKRKKSSFSTVLVYDVGNITVAAANTDQIADPTDISLDSFTRPADFNNMHLFSQFLVKSARIRYLTNNSNLTTIGFICLGQRRDDGSQPANYAEIVSDWMGTPGVKMTLAVRNLVFPLRVNNDVTVWRPLNATDGSAAPIASYWYALVNHEFAQNAKPGRIVIEVSVLFR